MSVSPTTPTPGSSVTFDASASTGGNGPAITDYEWNFGDGTPVDDVGASTGVQHTYASRGVYTVTLTVNNGAGSDSTTQTVTVDDQPTAAFTSSPASVAAPGASVSFDASASASGDPGGAITDYTWNFGDGTPADDTSSTAAATHAYTTPGNYTVTLTATDDLGVSATATEQVTVDAPAAAFTTTPATVVAPGTTVSFDASGSTDPEGTITDYQWNFGDGTPVDDAGTSTGVQRAYAARGTYTVTLTVTNNFGQTSTTTHTVTIDDPPTAAFTSSPATVAAPGATVSFNASASAPGASGGTITDYTWNFGDGTPADDTSGTAAATHAYTTPGNYTVTLTATDDLGVSATATEQLTVDAPAAAFTTSPSTPAPGSSVTFDASGSTDPEGTITDYSWNLGHNNTIDTGSTPSLQRQFWHRGVRTVTLTVTNNFGQTSTTTHTVTVDDPPTAAFTSSPATVAAPGATVSFNASASAPGASGGTITDYTWNFGDGTPADDTSGTAAATHAYTTARELHRDAHRHRRPRRQRHSDRATHRRRARRGVHDLPEHAGPGVERDLRRERIHRPRGHDHRLQLELRRRERGSGCRRQRRHPVRLRDARHVQRHADGHEQLRADEHRHPHGYRRRPADRRFHPIDDRRRPRRHGQLQRERVRPRLRRRHDHRLQLELR